MEIKGKFHRKASLLLDEKRISDINSLFLEFFAKVAYRVITTRDTEVIFNDIGELIKFQNYDEYKIKEIIITAYSNESLFSSAQLCIEEVKLNGMLFGITPSIICTYTLNHIDDEKLFLSKLNELIKAAKNNNILKRCILLPVFFVFNIGVFIWAISHFKANLDKDIIMMMSIAIWLASLYISKKCDIILFAKFYPIVVFYWGEQINIFDNISKLKDKIFWNVGVGSIIAALIGFAIYKFTGAA